MSGWILAIAACLTLLGAMGVALHIYIRRKVIDSKITKYFIRDMAENHLPHLHHVTSLIARKMGIDIGDPPPIRFIPFDKE